MFLSEQTDWIREASRQEKTALTAAFGGYAVDAFDYMIYTFMIPTLIATWGMTSDRGRGHRHRLAVVIGYRGLGSGVLADRYGTSQDPADHRAVVRRVHLPQRLHPLPGQLLFTRTMQGFGFGGEWSVGSVLIAEMIRPEHRGKAVGLVQSSWAVGWGVAAIAYALVYSVIPPSSHGGSCSGWV